MTGLFSSVPERQKNLLALKLGHSTHNKKSRIQLDFILIDLSRACVLSYKSIQWTHMQLWNFETEQFFDALKFVKNVRNGIGYKIRYERDRFKKRFERLKQLCIQTPKRDSGTTSRDRWWDLKIKKLYFWTSCSDGDLTRLQVWPSSLMLLMDTLRTPDQQILDRLKFRHWHIL